MGKVALPVNTVKVGDNVHIDIWDAETGELIERRQSHNTVVTLGLNAIRDYLYWMSTADGVQPFGVYYVSLGQSTAATASTSTGLGSEAYRDTPTQRTKGSATITWKLFLGSSNGNGSTFTEIGLHLNSTSTAANNGDLFSRALFTAVQKTSSIGLTCSWEHTFADDGV